MTPDPLAAVAGPARRLPRAAHRPRRPRGRPPRHADRHSLGRPDTTAAPAETPPPARRDARRGYQPGAAPPRLVDACTADAAGRSALAAELRDWVEHVYRPGYGHLAAALGPCWAAHDLCLYGLDILPALWCALYLQPDRTTGLLSAQAEYQARILPALAAQLAAETTRCGHAPAPPPTRSTPMTNPVLRRALAYADRGWPVFPCQPGQKIPATPHGYRDATTDPRPDHRVVRRPPGPEPGRRHRRPRPRRPGHRPARPRRQRLPRPRPAPRRRAARRRRRQRPHPQRRPAPLLHRLQPSAAATCPPATSTSCPPAATSWPRPRRSAASPTSVTGRPGQAGALDWAAVPPSWTLRASPACPSPGRARLPAATRPPGPLGRRPARRQPQQRPVLGRQPRPRNRPGRRPQPPGRRRPPGRPHRPRDHPHPRLRPPHQPGPSPPARPPGRGAS